MVSQSVVDEPILMRKGLEEGKISNPLVASHFRPRDGSNWQCPAHCSL